jgi:hypothetical protein
MRWLRECVRPLLDVWTTRWRWSLRLHAGWLRAASSRVVCDESTVSRRFELGHDESLRISDDGVLRVDSVWIVRGRCVVL